MGGAKLYFYYSSMNAGKSTLLLQSSYNYNERGLATLVFIPKIIGTGAIMSRIGLSKPAIEFDAGFDFFEFMRKNQEMAASVIAEEGHSECACVLVDEAQFLGKQQVKQLCRVADELQVPVLCYGLRSDFKGEPFEGSIYLLAWADALKEVKTVCHCGRKASMNQRVNARGEVLADGAQVEIGGNERYVGKCRMHFAQGLRGAEARVHMQRLHAEHAGQHRLDAPSFTSSSSSSPATPATPRKERHGATSDAGGSENGSTESGPTTIDGFTPEKTPPTGSISAGVEGAGTHVRT